jgi:hypothetical protein
LGAIQKVLDRVAQAIEPHSPALAPQARHAPGNDIDATPGLLTNALHWLWVMTRDTLAFSMIHPHRSQAAFAALIDDWAGILGSDGYGVDQTWGAHRQTCRAHLIRTARGWAERPSPALAACGAWALAELRRLGHMAQAPPTGGEWRAWYARLCKWIERTRSRGYKLAPLRTLVDHAGLLTQVGLASLQVHDLPGCQQFFETAAVLRAGDWVLEDRGFVDGATITLLKQQRRVDVIVPLQSTL